MGTNRGRGRQLVALGLLPLWLACGEATSPNAPAPLVSLRLEPSPLALPVGTSLQLSATGTYLDGSSRELTDEVEWSLSSPDSSTVSESGLLRGIWPGTSILTAKVDGITATAEVVVKDVPIALAITLDATSVPAGLTTRAAATLTTRSWHSVDVTDEVTWSVDAPDLATVDAHGMLQTIAPGTVEVRAELDGLQTSVVLTVRAGVLVGLAIEQEVTSLPSGLSTSLRCIGTWSDGRRADRTTAVRWSSNGCVDISSDGTARARCQGVAKISATEQGITATTTLTVTSPVLASLKVTTTATQVFVGQIATLVVAGVFSDGSTGATPPVVWSMSGSGEATVTTAGVFRALREGTVTATATATNGPFSGSVTIQVLVPVLRGLTLSPSSVAMAWGATQQLTATGDYTDNVARDVTALAEWRSSSPAVVVVGPGLIRGVSRGTYSVTASIDGKAVTVAVSVAAPQLREIAISPNAPRVIHGHSLALTANGVYEDGSTQLLTNAVAWSSDAPGVATLSLNGELISRGPGTAHITARYGTLIGSATATILPAEPVSAALLASTRVTTVGSTLMLFFVVTDTANGTTTVSSGVTWTLSDPTLATVSPEGLLRALAAGTVTVTAEAIGLSATLTISIAPS